MKMKARMSGQPRLDLGMLVSAVIIGDQMSLKFGRNVAFEVIRGPTGLS